MSKITRRNFLAGSALAIASPAVLRHALAQSAPINVGSLVPLSGGGGPYGAELVDAHMRVAALVNEAGGVLGRQINVISENGETNPEAGVRAARKLIDADRVIAILGTWASSVTMGIMPLCQDANVLQFFTSSSDDIPDIDKKGLAFDFQPLNASWAVAIARLAVQSGSKEIACAGVNNDFGSTMIESFEKALIDAGGKPANEGFLYNAGQPSFRAEAERLVRNNPPAVFVGGYVGDFTALYREIFRTGYKGKVFTLTFAAGPQFKTAVGDAANGVMHGFPVPPIGKDTYDAYLRFVGIEPNGQVQNPFGCAGYDQMNVLLLGIASANTTDVSVVKEHIHQIANGPGERVTTYAEGLKVLSEGKNINYDGASSSIDFHPNGMLKSRDFALYEIRDGKDVLLLRITSND